MVTFTEYIEINRKVKLKADINQRWETRVIAKGLDKMGQQGADEYLAQYGRGIYASKVALFAVKAEAENNPEMALGFWLKAYELETGAKADPAEYPAP